MGQETKNKSIFKSPVEITLVIGRVSALMYFLLHSTYCSIQTRCIVFITSAKIPEGEGSISSSNY